MKPGTLATLATLALSTALAALSPRTARADEALTLKRIDDVVEQNDRAVQACGRGQVRRGEQLAVMVLLTIDGDGHVADAFAPVETPASRCLERVARRMNFPTPGDTVRVNYPFLLVARR